MVGAKHGSNLNWSAILLVSWRWMVSSERHFRLATDARHDVVRYRVKRHVNVFNLSPNRH
jgi:hypothetical protein